MSYYGMRGMLVLFMTATILEGGLAIGTATAFAIYGLYTASVYFMGLPGGGLILVILGTGLLKPNISALVGQLYSSDDERRDSGYALYYMGINIGSIIGYMVCGGLAEKVGWHVGFGAAAVGMAFGLIFFHFTKDTLKGAGEAPASPMSSSAQRKSWVVIALFLVGLSIVTALTLSGMLVIDPIAISKGVTVAFICIFIAYFCWIYFGGKLSGVEKKGMLALLLVCIASTCFWSGFEQAGSSLNLFGRDFVDRNIMGWEMPTTWLQSINSWFIILLTPFFVYFWLWLGRKLWLSPIALSAVSKLSPKRYMAQLMGLFVLTYSMGNIIAGLLAGGFDPENVAEMPSLFTTISIFVIGVGAVVLLVGMFTKGWEKELEDANAEAEKLAS